MTYEAARKTFDSYAGMGAGELPANEMDALQVRLVRWQVANFGGAQDWQLALGVAEEVGELWEAKGDVEEADAVGDVMVYGTQLATACRLSASVIIAASEATMSMGQVGISVGKLAHAVLKRSQKIRGMGDVEAYREAVYSALVTLFSAVRIWSSGRGISARDAFASTASLVLRRDWTKNAVNGHPSVLTDEKA